MVGAGSPRWSGGHVPRVGVGGGRTELEMVPATAALMIVGTSQGSTKGGRRWPVRTG